MRLGFKQCLSSAIKRALGLSPEWRTSRRQLLVDVSILVKNDAGTGIQRVVRALSQELILADLENFDVRFIAATKRKRYCYLSNGIEADSRPASAIRVRPGDIFFGLDLAYRLLPRHARQIRKWRKAGVRVSAMVYDLLPATHPQWFSVSQAASFPVWLKMLATHADQAVCISQSVANDLAAWLERHELRRNVPLDIRAIPLGGDISSSKPSFGISPEDVAMLDELANSAFLMIVGTIEPRKGHRFVLDAFDLIWKRQMEEGPKLVLVGRPGWNTDDVQDRLQHHHERGKRLFWFADASDELLGALYKACSGILVPSLAEGLGLPLLEAAAQRLPVLARNLPVFREQQLPNVRYFDDDSPQALADKIIAWRSEGSYYTADQIKSLPTWNKSCAKLIEALGVN